MKRFYRIFRRNYAEAHEEVMQEWTVERKQGFWKRWLQKYGLSSVFVSAIIVLRSVEFEVPLIPQFYELAPSLLVMFVVFIVFDWITWRQAEADWRKWKLQNETNVL